ncbi:MAG: organomercurial transporter MerC [Paraburkholderia sp.]|uniref:organomercurial transporter MerC n=1 Tax=Paraburkholderia sp. TaxID=1926495 RepID=UPI0011FB8291|nr:organomercurial transporter MerC [Paraburkholderia sp.]TAM00966.1 MAG: organomercurial transporter MerC [Paraburkholderia sp.]
MLRCKETTELVSKECDQKLLTRGLQTTRMLDSIVSAMGCASCFPAIASLGAAIGLRFLSQFEGLFVTILSPVFAAQALVANALGWLVHRPWHHTALALGVIGPLLVLAAAYLTYGWRDELLLYVGLAFTVGVSIWDFISRRGPDGCDLPPKLG